MRTLIQTGLVVLLTCVSVATQTNLSGEWRVTVHDPFSPSVLRLSLSVSGETVTGSFGGRRLEGTVRGPALEFTIDNVSNQATLEGSELRGEAVFPDRTVTWTAVRIPPPPPTPKTHDFEPTAFHLYFSSTIEPVLRINPGDTVRTWSVDAGGRDKQGTRRSSGGNPQTGPFYVEGAMPNDTLVVRLTKVRTNRDWAVSGSSIMRNALEPGSLASIKWASDFPSRWSLDAATNVATMAKPTEALARFNIPLQPMLGCVAVAPPGDASVRTTDSGRFGGNMDYNQIREGTTVYLPVSHPGALLFVGDGHAAQGDGELTGDALETSMDIEFTVDVLPGRNFGHPLAENAEFLMSIGIGGSLDQALQQATSGMVRWLERDYGLNANEAAMVLGFAVNYDVADLVGTQVSIAAKVPRSTIAQLTKK